MDLVIKRVYKQVSVNGKDIKIPKLGLRHRMLFDPSKSHEESLKQLLATIHPNLSAAERQLVMVHILAYNERINASKTINGITYSVDDVFISQKLKFEFDDMTFKFKSPTMESLQGPIDLVLRDCCVWVKKGTEKIDVPDFMEMPAFVAHWAEQISTMVSFNGPKGLIKGLQDIVEFFGE